MTAQPYVPDLSDAEWVILAPLLQPATRRGRPRRHDRRVVLKCRALRAARRRALAAVAARVSAVAQRLRPVPAMAAGWALEADQRHAAQPRPRPLAGLGRRTRPSSTARPHGPA